METIIVRELLNVAPRVVDFFSNSVSLTPDHSNVEVKFTAEGQDLTLLFPLWYVCVAAIPFLSFFLTAWSGYYTFNVYATVMLVEDENFQKHILPETEPLEKEKLIDMDDDNTSPPQNTDLITSSVRSTAKFLIARSGMRSTYRGLKLATLKFLTLLFVCHALNTCIARNPDVLAAKIIANNYIYTTLVTLLVAPFSIAWVYYAISEPKQGSIFNFWPSAYTVGTLQIPSTIVAIVQASSIYLPLQIADLTGYEPSVFHIGHVEVLIALSWFVLLHINAIPVQFMLTRVYASTLPMQFKTIVPVDRTFTVTSKQADLSIGLLQSRITMSDALFKRLVRCVGLSTSLQLFNLAIVSFSVWNNIVNILTPLIEEAVARGDGVPVVSDIFDL